nr:MFS transporter [Kibdelosporangium sp. MJ126-NF4]
MRRDLALIVSGVGVSAFGTCLSRLVLMVQLKDHGAFALAALMIAALLPSALGAPIAGLLVDRLPNRMLMQLAQFLQAVATLAMAFLIDDIAAVLITTLLVGCGAAVADPAAATLAPRTAGPGDIAKGFAWLASSRWTGYVLGTAAGGVLITAVGGRNAILIDAGTFLVQALLLLFLRTDRDPRAEGGARGKEKKGAAMAGIRHLARDKVITVSLGGLAVVALCVALINVADVFLITDVLRGGVVLIGWVYAAWMVGSILGSRVAGRLVDQRAMVRTLGWAGAALGLAVLIPAVFAHTTVIVVAFLCGGFANGMQNVARQALVRLRTPEHMHGRAFAATDSVMRTANALGTMIAGFVVTGIGPRWSMGLAGAAATLISIGTLLVAREREPARVVETTRAG